MSKIQIYQTKKSDILQLILAVLVFVVAILDKHIILVKKEHIVFTLSTSA